MHLVSISWKRSQERPRFRIQYFLRRAQLYMWMFCCQQISNNFLTFCIVATKLWQILKMHLTQFFSADVRPWMKSDEIFGQVTSAWFTEIIFASCRMTPESVWTFLYDLDATSDPLNFKFWNTFIRSLKITLMN